MRSPVSACLDKRRKSTTGENKDKYPIKIKVNFKVREGKSNRYVVRRYPTGVFCKPGEFNRKKNDSAVILKLSKAMQLYEKNLSITQFERIFTGSGGLEDIKSIFESTIAKLREEERDGTADSYQQAYNSFVKFRGEFISFDSITVNWLKEYERWMLRDHKDSEGKIIQESHSINTVGIYCRALRTIFRIAIRLKIVSGDSLPFGIGLYVIPTGKRKTKKAFTREEKNIILAHRSDKADVNYALDFWAYQFFANGCNMADVAYLQYKDIDGDDLTFDRKKTENTERNKQSITVYIAPKMREVIAKHGNKTLDPDAYVFPILRPDMTSRQRKCTIKDFIKFINEGLSEAQKEINKNRNRKAQLTVKLTTGTARYTAATLLKRHGIDLSVIAKALGHGSEATTENYTEEERETQIIISKALSL